MSTKNKTIQQICDEDTGDSSLITNLVRRGKELEAEKNKMLTDWLTERAIFTKQIENLLQDKARLDWLELTEGIENGEKYEIECSITYKGNTGSQPMFPATRAGIDDARRA